MLGSQKQLLPQENSSSIAVQMRPNTDPRDYHLGRCSTRKDFALDFEGEPPAPGRAHLSDPLARCRRNDALVQYAAYSDFGSPRCAPRTLLSSRAGRSCIADERVFLQSYLETTDGAPFVPSDEGDFEILLEAYLLDKAVYEVGYELNNRPDWVVIPVRGIKHILGAS